MCWWRISDFKNSHLPDIVLFLYLSNHAMQTLWPQHLAYHPSPSSLICVHSQRHLFHPQPPIALSPRSSSRLTSILLYWPLWPMSSHPCPHPIARPYTVRIRFVAGKCWWGSLPELDQDNYAILMKRKNFHSKPGQFSGQDVSLLEEDVCWLNLELAGMRA